MSIAIHPRFASSWLLTAALVASPLAAQAHWQNGGGYDHGGGYYHGGGYDHGGGYYHSGGDQFLGGALLGLGLGVVVGGTLAQPGYAPPPAYYAPPPPAYYPAPPGAYYAAPPGVYYSN